MTDMAAGPELDAAVARLLGCTPLRGAWDGAPWVCGCESFAHADASTWRRRLAQYSTDDDVAWQVVEAICACKDDYAPDGYWARVETPFTDGGAYSVGFTPKGMSGWNGRPDYRAAAETFPLAVCRAASLLAAGTPQL